MSVIENMKEVAELAKKLGNIDLYTRILELRIEMNEINEEKLGLRLRVNELEEKARVQQQMTFRAPFWYRAGDDIPHCPGCFESHGRAIHLLSLDHSTTSGRFKCPVCPFLYSLKSQASSPSPRIDIRPFR